MANVEYKCPCCGGGLKFESSLQKTVCPFCDSEFEVEDLKQYNDDINENIEDNTEWDESRIEEFTDQEKDGLTVYSCNSCGGEIICDSNTSSTSCPYCGNPILVSSRLSGALKPNYVIPFKKDKASAMESLANHFKGKILLPSKFKSQNTIEEIKSLYVPFWIFDADVDAKIRYHATIVRRWSDSNYNYKETRHYSVVRAGEIAFDHIPVDGSKKMDDQLMESIEPFNFSEAVPFDGSYLAGYAADKYDVSKEETFNRATVRIKDGTQMAFRSTIHGYTSVETTSANIQLKDSKANYALYPVWILNTKWKDNTYHFAMNAQTGKMAGNLPISPVRFSIATIISFTIFTLLFGLLGWLLNEQVFDAIPITIGLIFGTIITIIIMALLWKKNKNVKFQTGAKAYVRENSMNIRVKRDIFLYRHVSKTRRQTQNNKH